MAPSRRYKLRGSGGALRLPALASRRWVRCRAAAADTAHAAAAPERGAAADSDDESSGQESEGRLHWELTRMTKRCQRGRRGATAEQCAACEARFRDDMHAFLDRHTAELQKLLGATSCIVRARTTHTSELLDAASKHIAGHMHTITLDQTLGLLDRYDTCKFRCGRLPAAALSRYLAGAAFRGGDDAAALQKGVTLFGRAVNSASASAADTAAFVAYAEPRVAMLPLASFRWLLKALVASGHARLQRAPVLRMLRGYAALAAAAPAAAAPPPALQLDYDASILILHYLGQFLGRVPDKDDRAAAFVSTLVEDAASRSRGVHLQHLIKATHAAERLTGRGIVPLLQATVTGLTPIKAAAKLPPEDVYRAVHVLRCAIPLASTRRLKTYLHRQMELEDLSPKQRWAAMQQASALRETLVPKATLVAALRTLLPFTGLALRRALEGEGFSHLPPYPMPARSGRQQAAADLYQQRHQPASKFELATGAAIDLLLDLSVLHDWPIVAEHLHAELAWLNTRLLELCAFRVHRDAARVAAGAATEATTFEPLAPKLHGLLHSHALNAELVEVEDTAAVADALACGVASLEPAALCTLFFDMRALRLRHPRLFAAAAAAATRHAAELHPMGLSHIIAACADLAVSDEALLDLAIRELEERAKRKEHLRVTTIMRAFTALAKLRRFPAGLCAKLLHPLTKSRPARKRDGGDAWTPFVPAGEPARLQPRHAAALAWSVGQLYEARTEAVTEHPSFLGNVSRIMSQLSFEAGLFNEAELQQVVHYAYTVRDRDVLLDAMAALSAHRAAPPDPAPPTKRGFLNGRAGAAGEEWGPVARRTSRWLAAQGAEKVRSLAERWAERAAAEPAVVPLAAPAAPALRPPTVFGSVAPAARPNKAAEAARPQPVREPRVAAGGGDRRRRKESGAQRLPAVGERGRQREGARAEDGGGDAAAAPELAPAPLPAQMGDAKTLTHLKKALVGMHDTSSAPADPPPTAAAADDAPAQPRRAAAPLAPPPEWAPPPPPAVEPAPPAAEVSAARAELFSGGADDEAARSAAAAAAAMAPLAMARVARSTAPEAARSRRPALDVQLRGDAVASGAAALSISDEAEAAWGSAIATEAGAAPVKRSPPPTTATPAASTADAGLLQPASDLQASAAVNAAKRPGASHGEARPDAASPSGRAEGMPGETGTPNVVAEGGEVDTPVATPSVTPEGTPSERASAAAVRSRAEPVRPRAGGLRVRHRGAAWDRAAHRRLPPDARATAPDLTVLRTPGGEPGSHLKRKGAPPPGPAAAVPLATPAQPVAAAAVQSTPVATPSAKAVLDEVLASLSSGGGRGGGGVNAAAAPERTHSSVAPAVRPAAVGAAGAVSRSDDGQTAGAGAANGAETVRAAVSAGVSAAPEKAATIAATATAAAAPALDASAASVAPVASAHSTQPTAMDARLGSPPPEAATPTGASAPVTSAAADVSDSSAASSTQLPLHFDSRDAANAALATPSEATPAASAAAEPRSHAVTRSNKGARAARKAARRQQRRRGQRGATLAAADDSAGGDAAALVTEPDRASNGVQFGKRDRLHAELESLDEVVPRAAPRVAAAAEAAAAATPPEVDSGEEGAEEAEEPVDIFQVIDAVARERYVGPKLWQLRNSCYNRRALCGLEGTWRERWQARVEAEFGPPDATASAAAATDGGDAASGEDAAALNEMLQQMMAAAQGGGDEGDSGAVSPGGDDGVIDLHATSDGSYAQHGSEGGDALSADAWAALVDESAAEVRAERSVAAPAAAPQAAGGGGVDDDVSAHEAVDARVAAEVATSGTGLGDAVLFGESLDAAAAAPAATQQAEPGVAAAPHAEMSEEEKLWNRVANAGSPAAEEDPLASLGAALRRASGAQTAAPEAEHVPAQEAWPVQEPAAAQRASVASVAQHASAASADPEATAAADGAAPSLAHEPDRDAAVEVTSAGEAAPKATDAQVAGTEPGEAATVSLADALRQASRSAPIAPPPRRRSGARVATPAVPESALEEARQRATQAQAAPQEAADADADGGAAAGKQQPQFRDPLENIPPSRVDALSVRFGRSKTAKRPAAASSAARGRSEEATVQWMREAVATRAAAAPPPSGSGNPKLDWFRATKAGSAAEGLSNAALMGGGARGGRHGSQWFRSDGGEGGERVAASGSQGGGTSDDWAAKA